MLAIAAPLIALVFVVALIWYLGGGSFGRNQTQAWIERARRHPRAYQFLDRYHGNFRAAAHYVEFGGLFLVLYWLWDALWAREGFVFRWPVAGAIAGVCVVSAWADEMHQLRSGTRQFRRVDFLHSCCGISISMAIVYIQSFLRGLA